MIPVRARGAVADAMAIGRMPIWGVYLIDSPDVSEKSERKKSLERKQVEMTAADRKAPWQYYAFRVDENDDTAATVVSFFDEERCSRVLALRHNGIDGENQHIHVVMELNVPRPIDGFRQLLKRQFSCKGNKDYSLKPWDRNEKAISYMFKEGQDIVHCLGYSEPDIERFKTMDVEVKQSIKKAKTEGMLATVIKTAKELQKTEVLTNRRILHIIIKYLKDHEKPYKGDWQIKNMIESVNMTLMPDVDFEDQVYDRLYR